MILALADSLTTGTLASFTPTVGSFVARDSLVATIETDKVITHNMALARLTSL